MPSPAAFVFASLLALPAFVAGYVPHPPAPKPYGPAIGTTTGVGSTLSASAPASSTAPSSVASMLPITSSVASTKSTLSIYSSPSIKPPVSTTSTSIKCPGKPSGSVKASSASSLSPPSVSGKPSLASSKPIYPSSGRPSSVTSSRRPSGTATPPTQKCYSGVYIILARGTTEAQNASLAESTAHTIISAIPDSAVSEVIYPASNDFGSSVTLGIANAKAQIAAYHAACPAGKIVLVGYSQGAWVIGDTLAGSALGTPISFELGNSVVAVVLFGDPFRVLGLGLEPDTCNATSPIGRSGSSLTNITHYGDRLDEYCNAGDPICCSTGTNPADHLGYFTTENNNAIASFVAGKAAALRRRGVGRSKNLF